MITHSIDGSNIQASPLIGSHAIEDFSVLRYFVVAFNGQQTSGGRIVVNNGGPGLLSFVTHSTYSISGTAFEEKFLNVIRFNVGVDHEIQPVVTVFGDDTDS